ncbi:DUF262 domain-containing protein [Mycolicibacterium sp. XJ775]
MTTADDTPATNDSATFANEEQNDTPVTDVDGEAPEEDSPTERQALRYYGVDFDVDGIQRRFERGDLIVPSFDPAPEDDVVYEGFQRRFVWSKKQMDRFVESLLLGYPVPGIFLVEEANRRFLILDGQQRIRTLHAFYTGRYRVSGTEKLFKLENVGSRLRGLSYQSLPEPDRRLLDSTILQATVVVPTGQDLDSVYRVFERINSGGIKLQPQEIRVALYMGGLIKLVRKLNSTTSWREMFGPPHSRLKDQELILRYMALLEYADALDSAQWDRARAATEPDILPSMYRPAMTTFLNAYLSRHRNLENLDAGSLESEFDLLTSTLSAAAGRDALRFASSQVNAAMSDAILVGASLALRRGYHVTVHSARCSIQKLRDSPEFQNAVLDSTSHAENVSSRLNLSFHQFARDAQNDK